MRLIILGSGTSTGVPILGCDCLVCMSEDSKDQRLRTSAMLQVGKINILIDCGPDYRQQMFRENLNTVDAVLITHGHRDHIAGLDDNRPIIFNSGKPLRIYAENNVIDELKQIFFYAFNGKDYPGIPEFSIQQITEEPFNIDGINIIPIRCFHHKLAILGFRIGKLAYITDANLIPESQFEKLRDLDVLVINALRQKSHPTHFSLSESLKAISIIKPKKAYLTHISHDMGLFTEVNPALPINVELAYDGLNISIED